jgi:hypothetical protein
MENKLEDSGKRKEFKSGARKDPGSVETYGRFDLIPPSSLKRLALIYAKGAKKYDDRNWEKGIPTGVCIDACLRHINRWREGSRVEDHLAQAAFWLFAIMFFESRAFLPGMVLPSMTITTDVKSPIAEYGVTAGNTDEPNS